MGGVVDIVGGGGEIWLAAQSGASTAWFGYQFIGASFHPLGAAGIAVGVLVEASCAPDSPKTREAPDVGKMDY